MNRFPSEFLPEYLYLISEFAAEIEYLATLWNIKITVLLGFLYLWFAVNGIRSFKFHQNVRQQIKSVTSKQWKKEQAGRPLLYS